MTRQNKILMAIAALMLVGVYLFPIWSISLEAPQYPEGIGLNIWVDTIEGKQPQDLQNINGLNHYIGMKPITPESIPELQIMPPLFLLLILGGLAVAGWGSRKWIMVWLILFVALAIVGLADFWLWEYDYGHNLDPNAPIKIPGMSYQPPLIGTKQLLNMRTTSMPHIGFIFALISMGLAGLTWWRAGKANISKSTEEKTATSEKKGQVNPNTLAGA
ncbi:hypothetical protein NC796_18650 [Aliifodinibius sp. S!AR15-10]|uniref:hypothetical protein n=1 Tax=Aliifodinibius sp. S!AR15-10 TaxID=2950437 RepID=UPI0028606668|nr:hypothetical protein [Aliifodinibius sp. S!AR15-10]MDR8393182.1 hypothetical protein [Aliifodinibius sp. S!AR15-10]